MAKKKIKKKYFEVEIPLLKTKEELLAKELNSLNNKTIKIDMTRKLRGKSTEIKLIVKIEGGKIIAYPKSLKLMPYFIKRMLRKKISYVEDSILTQSKESHIIIKPFLITRKKVSRVVRKTLRNSSRNWLIDYVKTKTNKQIFQDILSNTLQKSLSLKLKKIYPLSLCEIRILEIKKPLEKKEVEKEPKEKEPIKEDKSEKQEEKKK